MAKKRSNPAPLLAAINATAAPAYLVDASLVIAQANPALGEWVGLSVEEIVGRRVEYHSTEGAGGGLLTGLCPSPLAITGPRAIAGEHARGAVSCVGRDGRLRRRRADFLPLPAARGEDSIGANCPVLVLVAPTDLGPNQPADPPTADATADRLHAALASQLRREDSGGAPPCLLGPSAETAQLRRQAAAAASGASCLLTGRDRAELSELARWLQRRSAPAARLLPLDAGLLEIDQLEDRIVEASRAATESPVTILLERIDEAPAATQQIIAEKIAKIDRIRLLATAASVDGVAPSILTLASTIRFAVSPLSDRQEDLPLVAQWCVEQANAEGGKQVAGLAPEAVELLALYACPGGVSELRRLIGEAHHRATTATIEPGDLPTVVHQAALAAELPPRDAEAIVLDELLGGIERELIERALAQAGDNKAEAARLLGMTRPRLYRRLARLGMLDGDAPDAHTPDGETPDAPEAPPE